MENDILDALNDIGYEGPLNEEAGLARALDAGPKSLEYTGLVHALAAELRQLCRLEESVGLMTSPDDSSSFLLELSSFLKELGCPYRNMVTGHMSARLQSREERILLLDYLLSELMAARMLNVDRPTTTDNMKIVVQESPTAKDLKDILISLKFNKPPPNITPEVLFNKLYVKLKETIDKEGEQLVGKPLYNKALSEKQWKELEGTFVEMTEEYRLRRETLITRLECTIQSFEWSDRMKNRREEMQTAYRARRDAMRTKPAVRLAHFLAARTALLHVEKTSSASVRAETRSELNKLIIGRVPDRGGRPSEQQPPPPEMPSWQQRAPGGGRGGRGGERGGRGGGRGGDRGGRGGERGGRGAERGGRGGGRVQGGWSQGGGGGDQRRDSIGSTASYGSQGSQGSRPSTGRSGFQTYDVPPGGYGQNGQASAGYGQPAYAQGQGSDYGQGYSQSSARGQSAGYERQNSGYNQGYQKPGYQTAQADYQSQGQQSQGYQAQGQGYQAQGQGYQAQGQGYQAQGQGYQAQGYQAQGYQSGGGGGGGYRNEHDDRTSVHGRSNYNRGGRR